MLLVSILTGFRSQRSRGAQIGTSCEAPFLALRRRLS
jgi:hypothetical protein